MTRNGPAKSSRVIELERPPIIETAILVRPCSPTDSEDEVVESIEEMQQLAWTAGADVVDTIIQRRATPCPATLIGKGKVTQVKESCESHSASVVLFDSDLTPTQGSNLEEALGVKVLDRTQLILDIFAQRAQTAEGKHQVELAQLQYLLPRLTGLRSKMMRQQGGIGVRGPGEQKLEVDRRVVRGRIRRLTDELMQIRKRRRTQRKRRVGGGVSTVALVGYTNAGKSSLLNALSNSEVFVEDKLFATLDPCSRKCVLPSGREIVITDTVGFIRKLPHSLVAAFRATLEETAEADLLLMVVDAAHPAQQDHIRAVFQVLNEIEADDKVIVTVWNKIDIADPLHVHQLSSADDTVCVSARTRDGLDRLLGTIERRLASNHTQVQLRIPQSRAGAVSRIYDGGRVLSQRYDDDGILLEAELDKELLEQLREFIVVHE